MKVKKAPSEWRGSFRYALNWNDDVDAEYKRRFHAVHTEMRQGAWEQCELLNQHIGEIDDLDEQEMRCASRHWDKKLS